MRYGRRRSHFPRYVPVAERRAKAERLARKAREGGAPLSPVQITGRKISHTFWGQAWCDYIERFHDYENRLPRGRTYVRNGSVIDLKIARGRITGQVVGSRLYEQEVAVQTCTATQRRRLVKLCSQELGSVVDLLDWRLSENVMDIMVRSKDGLLAPSLELSKSCSCPDWSFLCKHLAAVLYGVGARLDDDPSLLFVLRGLDPADLVSPASIPGIKATTSSPAIEGPLSEVFGIEISETPPPSKTARAKPVRRKKKAPARKLAKKPARKPASRTKAPKKPSRKGTPRRRPTPRTLTRQTLLERGIPSGTISSWVSHGLLLPTKTRGTYRLTSEARKRLASRTDA